MKKTNMRKEVIRMSEIPESMLEELDSATSRYNVNVFNSALAVMGCGCTDQCTLGCSYNCMERCASTSR